MVRKQDQGDGYCEKKKWDVKDLKLFAQAFNYEVKRRSDVLRSNFHFDDTHSCHWIGNLIRAAEKCLNV